MTNIKICDWNLQLRMKTKELVTFQPYVTKIIYICAGGYLFLLAERLGSTLCGSLSQHCWLLVFLHDKKHTPVPKPECISFWQRKIKAVLHSNVQRFVCEKVKQMAAYAADKGAIKGSIPSPVFFCFFVFFFISGKPASVFPPFDGEI